MSEDKSDEIIHSECLYSLNASPTFKTHAITALIHVCDQILCNEAPVAT